MNQAQQPEALRELRQKAVDRMALQKKYGAEGLYFNMEPSIVIQLIDRIAELEGQQAAPDGLREAAQRAHDWMGSQADSQSKGCHSSFDLMCLREERDALAVAIVAAPTPPAQERKP